MLSIIIINGHVGWRVSEQLYWHWVPEPIMRMTVDLTWQRIEGLSHSVWTRLVLGFAVGRVRGRLAVGGSFHSLACKSSGPLADAHLGPQGVHLGPQGVHLDPQGVHLDPQDAHSGRSGGHWSPHCSWEAFGTPMKGVANKGSGGPSEQNRLKKVKKNRSKILKKWNYSI